MTEFIDIFSTGDFISQSINSIGYIYTILKTGLTEFFNLLEISMF
ncbi:Uncharacterized protein dnm_035680 [Desulfonema magnum]|uniref:Uncharacterized protein n=1 Tax=Desulfonema magnum TaxID=45655 RepID=A0A975BM56_9BACT|nr:Uncharacterized protein dnm_035680 [Desulfonema magnum]